MNQTKTEEVATLHKTAHSPLTILDLWYLCVSRWRWFVVSTSVCMLFAVYHLIRTPNQYTRTAAIMVREESLGNNSKKTNDNEFSELGFVKQENNLTNVVRHITSLEVLVEVVNRLKLPIKDEEIIYMALEIQSRLSVVMENDKSTIIDLTYSDYSTAEAEHVLMLIIQVYNEKWLETKHQATKNTSLFIDSRLSLLERDLNIVDDSIALFKSRYGITNLEHVSDLYLQQQNQSDAEIMRLSNEKAMAGYIKSLLDDETSKYQLLLVNSGINNSIIESQITLYNSLLLQMQSHLDYTSEQNPMIVYQEKEINNLRDKIRTNINNHIHTLDIQLSTIQSYYDEATSKIISNPVQAKHLATIERERKVKESLYMFLLQKKEENEISMTYRSSNAHIIDLPHGSDKPSSPKKKNVIFAALLLGIMIPVVVIFLRNAMSESVNDGSDIESRGDLPFLGEVPFTGKRYLFSFLKKMLPFLKRFQKQNVRKRNLVVAAGWNNPVNEAFRMIRTRFEATIDQQAEKGKVYQVTSAKEGDGKTFIAINLALSLAIVEKRVLFIDGDLRRATASSLWDAPKRGLVDYLDGRTDTYEPLLFHPKDYPTLDVLPVGLSPVNPVELLRSSLFSQFLETVRTQYDVIIIDSPTTGLLADAEIIGQNADHILFVIRAGHYRRNRLEELKTSMPGGKGHIPYIVLNGVSIDNTKYNQFLHYVYSSSIQLH